MIDKSILQRSVRRPICLLGPTGRDFDRMRTVNVMPGTLVTTSMMAAERWSVYFNIPQTQYQTLFLRFLLIVLQQ